MEREIFFLKNSPDHGANHCKEILKNRYNYLKEFNHLYYLCGLKKKNNIFDYLLEVFFCIDKIPAKFIKRLEGHTSNVIFKIFADHKILYDNYSNKIGMNKNEEINLLDKDVDSDDDKKT